MASSVNCDLYGFFNGVFGIEHSNWANYWHNVMPDGVISAGSDTSDNELEVYARSDGMKVHVKSGSALVAGHRCWVNSEKVLDIAANSTGDTRTDGIFVRVTYGDYGESRMTLVVKTGNITPKKTIGSTYELLLATVDVPNGASTIAASAVTDQRYVFRLATDAPAVLAIEVTESSGTYTGIVNAKNDRIHKYNSNPLKSLRINLPYNASATFMTEVDFTSSSDFTGVKIYQNGSLVSPRIAGDALTLTGKRYNMLIWADATNRFWVAAKAVA